MMFSCEEVTDSYVWLQALEAGASMVEMVLLAEAKFGTNYTGTAATVTTATGPLRVKFSQFQLDYYFC